MPEIESSQRVLPQCRIPESSRVQDFDRNAQERA
jgi:hypothetical protein